MRFFIKSALFLIFLISITSISPQNKKNKANPAKKDIVASFKGENISIAEFNRAFEKAGILKKTDKIDTLQEKKNFLNLYLNYRMKLRDALDKGYDKLPETKKEIEEYRNSIASSMYLEKEVIEKGIKDLYEKRKYEVRIAHIFIKYDSSQTDLGMEKAKMVLDKIKAGAKFEDMVLQYSDDENSKFKQGDLYYLNYEDVQDRTMVSALFETEPGTVIDNIFDTFKGYHIIKVLEKKPRIWGIHLSHILTLYNPDGKGVDSARAKNRIFEAYTELKNGVPFETVAAKYSDDKNSSQKGGAIGVAARNKMVRNLEEEVLKLKENELSDILKTDYGYHVFKATKIDPAPSYEEEREKLRTQFKQTKNQESMQRIIRILKMESNYRVNASLFDKLFAVRDSFLVGDDIYMEKLKKPYKDSILVTINNAPVHADSLFEFMENSEDIAGKRYMSSLLSYAHEKFITKILINRKALSEYRDDPAFLEIMKDYKEGILSFKVTEQNVWSKVKVDSIQAKKYWNANKEKYRTKQKYAFSELFLNSAHLRDSVYAALKNGTPFDELLKKWGKQGVNGSRSLSADESPLAAAAARIDKAGNYAEPLENNGGWSIIRLDANLPPRIKTFEEAKGEVSAAVQEIETGRIDAAYIKSLAAKYKPVLYSENIK